MTPRDRLWIGFVVWGGLGTAHGKLFLALCGLASVMCLAFPRILDWGGRSRVTVEREPGPDPDLAGKREPRGRYADPEIDELDP